MEINKFNGKSFEFWKLNMGDLLVDIDKWIVVDPGTAPTRTSTDDCKKLDQKEKRHNMIVSLRFSIIDCVRGSYNQRLEKLYQ
jgi:hypothetical protein